MNALTQSLDGLLMFGFEFEITPVFPNYFLDFQENRTNGIYARWTDRLTSQSGDWSGNVFDFILKVIPKLQSDLKVPFMFKGNRRDENTPLHKTLREATVNMLANADFYGRRGVVVQKGAEGFKFANPGSMRVSLAEAIRDSASDPRNSVMMKMLAMVEYGERVGSGLQGIFRTWEAVYHTKPLLVISTSGGVDRTVLTLPFGGNQPDIEAMKAFYDDPNDLIEIKDVAQKGGDVAQSVPQNTENVAQKGGSVAKSVSQSTENVAQNLDSRIIELIKGTSNIKRDEIALRMDVTKKTIERHLKELGISWEGHPKTGHWKLPESL